MAQNFDCYNMTDQYSQHNILKMRNQKLQTSCIGTYQMLWLYVVHNNFPNFSFLSPFKLGFDIPGGICDVVHSWNTVRHRSLHHLRLQGWFVAWFENINLKARWYWVSWRGEPADNATLEISIHLIGITSIVSSKWHKDVFSTIGAYNQTNAL